VWKTNKKCESIKMLYKNKFKVIFVCFRIHRLLKCFYSWTQGGLFLYFYSEFFELFSKEFTNKFQVPEMRRIRITCANLQGKLLLNMYTREKYFAFETLQSPNLDTFRKPGIDSWVL
jgi:hypothetical protein